MSANQLGKLLHMKVLSDTSIEDQPWPGGGAPLLPHSNGTAPKIRFRDTFNLVLVGLASSDQFKGRVPEGGGWQENVIEFLWLFEQEFLAVVLIVYIASCEVYH